MSMLGRNVKVTAARDHRHAIRGIFERALGAALEKSSEAADIYRLTDDRVGFFWVDSADALTPEQAKKGAWLEILVEDPPSLRGELDRLGARRFAYVDEAHDYYALPGGQVFRLAPRSAPRG